MTRKEMLVRLVAGQVSALNIYTDCPLIESEGQTLVRNAEMLLAEIEKVCPDEAPIGTGRGPWGFSCWQPEREACAKVAEEHNRGSVEVPGRGRRMSRGGR